MTLGRWQAGRPGRAVERPPVEIRFALGVIVGDDCWEWGGRRDARGYGKLSDGRGNDWLAHRLAWTILVGPIPGLHVLHHCDNPPCVRPGPDHLFLGTDADNSHDMWAKGRGRRDCAPKGEASGTARLTEADILAIRAASGLHREIAARFDVSPTLVSLIRARKRWAHVPEGAERVIQI